MISIILIEPEISGNIGAVARCMKNFNFYDLILINPKCDPKNDEAVRRSKHAKDILLNAKVCDFDGLDDYDYIIATTSQLGANDNLARSPLNVAQLAKKIPKAQGKIGIVFGRESKGLSNEEISKCDFTVTIPSFREYPTLNLSHSVAIVVYELFKEIGSRKSDEQIIAINDAEKKQILNMVDQVLDNINFATEDMKKTQKTFWKRLIGKSFLTKSEAYVLMGFLRHLIKEN